MIANPKNLRLGNVDKTNLEAILALELSAEQVRLIPSVEKSLAQAYVYKFLSPFVVYRADDIIGFGMFGGSGHPRRFWFHRLLLDQRFQGQGLGSAAFGYCVDILVHRNNATRVFLTVHPDNLHARGIYERQGFRHNGEYLEFEPILSKDFPDRLAEPDR